MQGIMPLELYRRHTPRCKEAKRVAKLTGRREGRDVKKCDCPWWCDEFVDDGVDANGNPKRRRIRRSTGTRDKRKAQKKVDVWEGGEQQQLQAERVTITAAIARFEVNRSDLRGSTKRKYKNIMNQLAAFCEGEGVRTVDEFTPDSLDDFRASRKIGRTTWGKELQTLKQLFKLCKRRGWIAENPTDDVKAPKAEPKIEPFTPKEMAKILAACNEFGRRPYERLRARAMVLLLRHTGLRISDVATLRRDRIQDGEIFLHAKKNTGVVKLPLPQEVLDALAVLPPPIGAPQMSQCFFWNEVTSERAVVGIAERTLAAVVKKSGVPNAHSHRFRHTLATAILERGGTEQDAADVLGISPAVARKHYIHWTRNRQERISKLMAQSHTPTGTLVVQMEEASVIQ